MKNYLKLALFILSISYTSLTSAQATEKRVSPADSTIGKIGDIDVKIRYGSPSVKGREIWGKLVPYKEVWRAGANEATTIEFSKNVMVEGKKFAIPDAENWTIIFNKEPNQWGAFKYDAKMDALRVTAKAVRTPNMQEQLKYIVNRNGILLSWEKMVVLMNIQAEGKQAVKPAARPKH
jgi:hypothetical protein